MTNGTTQHIPADVRERVARECVEEAERLGRWYGDGYAKARRLLREAAALILTPRGEGEAAAMSASLSRALAAMQAAWIEWRRGRGADAAMQWIENTLIGPGLIPGDDESDAQVFFDRAIAEIESYQIRHAAAILRTPRDEEEAWRAFLDALDEVETTAASLWAEPEGPTAEDMERLDRARQRVIECALVLAARRSEAQGEEDVGEFCDLCGEEFDPSELGTVIGPLGQDDGVPRWYRCPRCARAYDAGYQQGQRDPRGDEIADPTAIRSDADALDLIRWAEARAVALEPVAGNIMPPGTYACYAGDGDDPYMGPGILGAIRAARRGEEQGQERWEDLVFGPIVEAYNEAHDARRSEGGSNGLE